MSFSFKITAENEIRKRKLMFCVLLRGGVVSALYRICCFIAMKCVYIVFLLSVAWFQLALISSDYFESFFQSAQYGSMVCRRSSMEKALYLRLFNLSCVHPQWRSGYESSGQPEGTGFRFCCGPSSSLLPFFFSFLFCLLICFAFFCFCLFLNIYLNK